MANKNMKGSEGWSTKDVILTALAQLDKRGTNREVSLAMAIVQEAFTAEERGESVGSFELFQRASWAESIGASCEQAEG
jgi:hypothetical protein